jgi:hypothetical protein
MLGVYTIVGVAEPGRSLSQSIMQGAIAAAMLVAFLVRQARARAPLLPLGIFRSRNVAGSNLIMVLMIPGIFGMFFLGSLYLQRVLGYGPLDIGLAFLPVAVVIGFLSYDLSARIATRFGAVRVLVPALGLIVVGLLWLVRTPVQGQYLVDLLPAFLLLGVGAGLGFPALMTVAMVDATQTDAGLASGLINTTAQVGGALGLAVLATLAASRSEQGLSEGMGAAAALTSGYTLAWLVGAVLVLAAIGLAAALPRRDSEISRD